MTDPGDSSNGYDALVGEYISARSLTGQALVRDWAKSLPPEAAIIDLGAGSGEPITSVLIEAGFNVSALDASPRMVEAFRARFPDVEMACEPVEESNFFGRTYDAVIAIGLIFLLEAELQKPLIKKVAKALNPGGRFLFSAPTETGEWDDVLTGRRSVSLGQHAYNNALTGAGFESVISQHDEGGSHYYDAVKSTYLAATDRA